MSDSYYMLAGLRYKKQYACFTCRKVYKANFADRDIELNDSLSRKEQKICPQCKKAMYYVGMAFKAPPQKNIKAWQKLLIKYQ